MAVKLFLTVLCLIYIAGIHRTLSQAVHKETTLTPRDNIVREMRSKICYPYEKQYHLKEIHSTNLQEDKRLTFNFPYFGFNYNYTWVSLYGALFFSRPPPSMRPPFKFPIGEWPRINDPALIAPFYAVSEIGEGTTGTMELETPPGVYFQEVASMGTEANDKDTTQFKVDLREALRIDLQEGMIGAVDFIPKHAVIVTWRNVTFGSSQDPKITNTYQLILITDEMRTYMMFNYERIIWFSSGSGGAGHTGVGGTPAFVGFNAGNGTRSFEYVPYSQSPKVIDLVTHGLVNDFPGRHVFRVDEEILPGVCNFEPNTLPKLTLSPESGHMLGGTVVNVSGPCFTPDQKYIRIKFHDRTITCTQHSRSMATCVTPPIFSAGYVDVHTFPDVNGRAFSNKFYIENPMIATESVRFATPNAVDKLEFFEGQLGINWEWNNLTWNKQAQVHVSLWGYREYATKPDLIYIADLAESTPNSGQVLLELSSFYDRDDGWKREFTFGLIQINTTYMTSQITPFIWSHPIPLGWYFHKQWVRYYGDDWAVKFCDQWNVDDRRLKTFAHEVPRCPCTRQQADADKGRFAPDFGCDFFGNAKCYGNEKTVHCLRSGQSSAGGAGQQCCYGTDGDLVMNVDMKEGGVPSRSHPFGLYPFDKSTEIPGMSHWYHDRAAYYTCCLWQSEMTESCYQYKWRRASQDCVGYQPPNASVVFGDPHIITFDNLEYTFNGRGEFSLVTVQHQANVLDVQGRFEQIIDYEHNRQYPATQLTAVVARDNVSIPIEVQIRPPVARHRYRLNVLAEGKRIYFDRPALKLQVFKGVTVYCPYYIHNQSHIVIMFQSGAGVEVTENGGNMAARVYLPKTFMNITRGLMGNWSNDVTDDLALPEHLNRPPMDVPPNGFTNFERVHRDFGLHWMLLDSVNPHAIGVASYFTHENARSTNTFNDPAFVPVFEKEPKFNASFSMTENDILTVCGSGTYSTSYQCRYDFLTTHSKSFAQVTKFNADSFRRMKNADLKTIITCGALQTPRHGRKSSHKYVIGTKVSFECESGYILDGEAIRYCYTRGEWSWTEYGITRCLPVSEYNARKAGITSGIVLGILIPIIIGAICLFGFIVSKRNDSSYRESHQMTTVDDGKKRRKPTTTDA